ncbi:hypothetical protein Bca4012_062391 [Brassica carinata]|uniref:Uncharacterized protein n=1 Tax=Brassica carinata TaxID=52824 RepID=A0A8X7SC74_BRACI|nr:hypothetical protein Bca52824_032288 [Brassica carinata]
MEQFHFPNCHQLMMLSNTNTKLPAILRSVRVSLTALLCSLMQRKFGNGVIFFLTLPHEPILLQQGENCRRQLPQRGFEESVTTSERNAYILNSPPQIFTPLANKICSYKLKLGL